MEAEVPVQVRPAFDEPEAAVRDRATLRGDPQRGDHRHGRGPASDVDGAVLSLALPAADHHVGRARHDGLRLPRGYRRCLRPARPDGDRRGRRRQLRHDPHGTRHRRRIPGPGQGGHPQQPLSGHGPSVAGTVLWQALRRLKDVQSRLRPRGGGLRRQGHCRSREGPGARRDPDHARDARPGRAGCPCGPD